MTAANAALSSPAERAVQGANRTVTPTWLGRRRYEPVHQLQKDLQRRLIRGEGENRLLLVEHEPVITLGRGAHESNIVWSEEQLTKAGIDVVETGRGGDVTYHAPGQLVAYPIVDLRPDRCDVRKYIRDLTEVMRRLVGELGIEAGEADGMVGLWADADNLSAWAGIEWAARPLKLGAIGVRLSRWVTMHGFALNLRTDLSGFSTIVPCGITNHGVASVESLTGTAPSVEEAARRASELFRQVFGWRAGDVIDASASPLDDLLEPAG